MGKKYGPGYAFTNGMEGRSNWSFFGDNLEVKYSASNKFTGKLHNATEVYKLTNFRRNVSFDDKSEIPATWEVWADWGNHKYNMELKHYSKYEYIDIFSLGLSEKILSKAGFIKINKKRKNIIIPNYFEPFIRRNIDIKYFTDLKNLKNLRIFKSDGDQDRPNFF